MWLISHTRNPPDDKNDASTNTIKLQNVANDKNNKVQLSTDAANGKDHFVDAKEVHQQYNKRFNNRSASYHLLNVPFDDDQLLYEWCKGEKDTIKNNTPYYDDGKNNGFLRAS